MFEKKFTRSSGSKITLLSRRMFFLSGLKLLTFGSIIAKLFSLQVSENKKYKTLSDKNRIREWKLAPKRGLITDFFGENIAGNAQIFQLHLVPENVVDYKVLFFRLKKIIDLDATEIAKIEKKIKFQKPWEPIIISSNLSWRNFSRLNLFLHELPGVDLVVSVARRYKEKEAFAHTVGYVGAASVDDITTNEVIRNAHMTGLKVGKTGLEKALNDKLLGSAGFQRYEVNAYGKRIKEIQLSEGKQGNDFTTTLDTQIQKFISGLLIGKSGSVCVMDVYTGDIIAMVSSPTFDPNNFVYGINQKTWDSLLQNDQKPLLNKSIAGLYPPGSTIKPIVALSALEFDVINPKFLVKCTGSMELYGQKYHCWKKKGHGHMTLRNAIKQSCDIYFYEVARRLGVDRLSITSKRFGLGERILNGFLEEKKGIVPNTKWKLKNIGRGWVLGETLISGIGQGYFQSTPLQLCLMVAQLANGGFKIRPRIVNDGSAKTNLIMQMKADSDASKKGKITTQELLNADIFDPIGVTPLFRNQENVKFVTEAMYASTNEVFGTSYASRHIKSKYIYAGKTGTSQVKKITEEERELEIKSKDLPYKQRDHALFTAFAPYKFPKYAFSVVIEHSGTGSSVAAPIAKQVIKKTLDRDEAREVQKKIYMQEV